TMGSASSGRPTTPFSLTMSAGTSSSGAGSNQRRGRSPSLRLDLWICRRTIVPISSIGSPALALTAIPDNNHAQVVLLVVCEGVPDGEGFGRGDVVADQAVGAKAALTD